jgi:hypothetical protein
MLTAVAFASYVAGAVTPIAFGQSAKALQFVSVTE